MERDGGGVSTGKRSGRGGGGGAGVHRTILVVEGNPPTRRQLGDTLRHAGYRVLEAGSADDAQRLALDGRRIDLVLTGCRVHTTNGIQLALWFRHREPQMPVLVTTGSCIAAGQHGRAHPDMVCRPGPWSEDGLCCTVAGMFERPAA